MNNVLVINNYIEPSVLIFNEVLLKSLNNKYNLKIVNLKNLNINDLNWADICVTIRTLDLYEAYLIKFLKKYKTIVLMLDDDFFSIKNFCIDNPICNLALITTIKNSDYFFVSNLNILNKFKSFIKTEKIFKFELYIENNDIKYYKDNKNSILNFAYYSNDGKTYYFNKIFIPVLRKFFEKYNEKIKFTFFAVNPDLSEFNDKIEKVYYERTDLKTFRKLLSENYFDIGITVIDDTEFSKSKYVNHFFEYTRAGIASIYSNVTPYKEFVINNETGILCDNNDIDSWVNAILKLKNIEFRGEIVNKAQDFLIKNYSKNIIQNFYENFNSIKIKKNKKIFINYLVFIKIKFYIVVFFILIKKGYRRFKCKGLKSVFDWTINHYIRHKI